MTDDIKIEVAVACPAPKTYTYSSSSSIASLLKPGKRVLVPFGSKRITGYVLGEAASEPKENIKQILEVLDEFPLFPQSMIPFFKWIADYYKHPIGEVIKCALPAGLNKRDYSRRLLKRRKIYRGSFGETIEPDIPPVLTNEQENAVEKILSAIGNGYATYLLTGVTGSGKTEVYMRIADKVLKTGQNVIVLVPEIALISQVERRFRARFGECIAVLHSGLSNGERYDQWIRIIEKKSPIAIGARSAIFAPFDSVGLIIVDEEHEASFKQDHGLMYNARDLAVKRASLNNCLALLGSATPSIQSFYNFKTNKYRETALTKRVEERPLSKIEIVDLRKIKDLRGIRRFMSQEMITAMRETLDRKEQILLFLNRRGFSNLSVCNDCGEAIKCKNCDIALTLHKSINAYQCHYCGFTRAIAGNCGVCGSSDIRNLGLGTEKLENAVKKLFPEANTARMDSDTTKKKGSILKLLKDIRSKNIDILVGTQMIAKGHDFPDITLVGIICADLSLSFPDFRSGTRTFQLLAQVAGRAGRGDAPGRVILQTYNPDHFIILEAKKQDFKSFYEHEIKFRKSLQYPPFSRLIMLKILGKDYSKTKEHALTIGEEISKLKKEKPYETYISVLGPIESPIAMIKKNYRWQIILKSSKAEPLHGFINRLIIDRRSFFNNKQVKVLIDVDPVFMM
jgi:primosomal protein N' (replication factor Y)